MRITSSDHGRSLASYSAAASMVRDRRAGSIELCAHGALAIVMLTRRVRVSNLVESSPFGKGSTEFKPLDTFIISHYSQSTLYSRDEDYCT